MAFFCTHPGWMPQRPPHPAMRAIHLLRLFKMALLQPRAHTSHFALLLPAHVITEVHHSVQCPDLLIDRAFEFLDEQGAHFDRTVVVRDHPAHKVDAGVPREAYPHPVVHFHVGLVPLCSRFPAVGPTARHLMGGLVHVVHHGFCLVMACSCARWRGCQRRCIDTDRRDVGVACIRRKLRGDRRLRGVCVAWRRSHCSGNAAHLTRKRDVGRARRHRKEAVRRAVLLREVVGQIALAARRWDVERHPEVLDPRANSDAILAAHIILQPHRHVILLPATGDDVVVGIQDTPRVGPAKRLIEVASSIPDGARALHRWSQVRAGALICWCAMDDATNRAKEADDKRHHRILLHIVWQ
eukprot:3972264-Prymnesium_polylepis.1